VKLVLRIEQAWFFGLFLGVDQTKFIPDTKWVQLVNAFWIKLCKTGPEYIPNGIPNITRECSQQHVYVASDVTNTYARTTISCVTDVLYDHY
jgi:hypothetical protein